jgi:outer membrane immunogenic protein
MQGIRSLSVLVVALAAMAGLPALGADLPTKAPPVPYYTPPQFNWTGWYFGANVGGGWTQGTVVDTATGGSFGASNQGTFIGGGQAGFNYQIGNAVFGVEGFFDGIAQSNHNTSTVLTGMGGNLFQASANANWVATVAGRVGFTGPGFDHWLFYGKGGGAWVEYNSTITDFTTGFSASTTNTQSGWMAGAGIEWAFAPFWTAKVEYQYIGLNNGFNVGAPLGLNQFAVHNPNIQTATFGINYLFHWGNSL